MRKPSPAFWLTTATTLEFAVLLACGVDLDWLRREVLNYLNNELGNLVDAHGDDAKPTAGFHRVLQRAAIHVQSSGRDEVTAQTFSSPCSGSCESHAVNFLQEQDMTRSDAVNFISHGIAKAPGCSETHRDHEETRSASPRYSGETPPVDETKIIAAILCGQTMNGEDHISIDHIRKIVDLYHRILDELRARSKVAPKPTDRDVRPARGSTAQYASPSNDH
jgi:ATP-dependent Clp protease ATP-binding subunit ClpA